MEIKPLLKTRGFSLPYNTVQATRLRGSDRVILAKNQNLTSQHAIMGQKRSSVFTTWEATNKTVLECLLWDVSLCCYKEKEAQIILSWSEAWMKGFNFYVILFLLGNLLNPFRCAALISSVDSFSEWKVSPHISPWIDRKTESSHFKDSWQHWQAECIIKGKRHLWAE